MTKLNRIRTLERLRDDDLELIASLALKVAKLDKALLDNRENLMLLMEYLGLYFESGKRVNKDKK